MIGSRPPRPAPERSIGIAAAFAKSAAGTPRALAPFRPAAGMPPRAPAPAGTRAACVQTPPRETYAPRRRAKHTRAKREKRPAEPMALRAISIRHSNFFVRFRISIQLYEALLRYSFKCAIKGADGILPCLHTGNFLLFYSPFVQFVHWTALLLCEFPQVGSVHTSTSFCPPAEPCAPLDVKFRPITNAERVRGDLRKTPPPPAASKHIYLIRLPLRRYPCALFRKEPTQTCILGMQAARVLRGLWVYRKGSFGFSLLVLLL